MQLPVHIQIIFKLNELRDIINGTLNKDLMMETAATAIKIASPIETKKEGKEKILQVLENEIRSYGRSTSTEIEVVQFQLSSSILMLCLQFLEGGCDDMQAFLIEYNKRAA